MAVKKSGTDPKTGLPYNYKPSAARRGTAPGSSNTISAYSAMRGGAPRANPDTPMGSGDAWAKQQNMPSRPLPPNFLKSLITKQPLPSKGVNLGRPKNPAEDTSGIFSFGDAPSIESFLSSSSSSADPGGAYAARLADLEKRKQEAMQAIGFGSQALAGKLTDSRGVIDARYTQGLAEQQADQEKNSAALGQGNAAAAAANAQLQANLGIVTDNSRAAEDLQFDQADLANRSQAAYQAMRGNQLSQFTLGTRNADAANFRGFEEQASSRRNFDTSIADLLDQQAAARAAAQESSKADYGQARNNWEQDRNFAYQEWVRGQENDREDAQNLLQYEQEAGQGAKPSAYDQLMATLQVKDPQTAKTWYNRTGSYKKAASGQPSNFDELWGGASPSNQAAIRAYLKAAGLI